jgi:arginase
VESLRRAGLEVDDHGDRDSWRWRPDRENRRAQNLATVVEIVGETAVRVGEAAAPGAVTLTLGGDCTVGIGAVAGHVASGERVGLLYFDTHADLNVPDSVPEGALDWMGMAHMLDEPGARPELSAASGLAPLLRPEQVVLFGWGPEQATEFEREAISRREIATVAVDEVAADPEAAAARALGLLEPQCDRLLVHFDVDVVDFTDTPLSENTGRNEGLPFETALRALDALLASHPLAGLTITELNPDHTEEGGDAIERLVTAVAAGLGR